jgi:DNA-binding Lrp family transcriptional regulator
MQHSALSSHFLARDSTEVQHANERCYIGNMDDIAIAKATRRPRFRRATAPLPFRVTDGDVEIIQNIARHRFLRSTHIAALVGRSLDRTNDRLSRLFHAGYIDRPRAQLDYYATSGSAPMVYALADLGGLLLTERFGEEFANLEWSRKNREAGRPFIEHQLEIVDFEVALQLAARGRSDIRLIHSDELNAGFPEQTRRLHNPLALRVTVSHGGKSHEIGLIPDLIFGLGFPDSSRRCFMVEIDRGTMPISRSDISQTSFERKMLAYLSAHAAGQHEQQFGWKTFRVLTVTTDQHRVRSMTEALRTLDAPQNPGPSLFFFALRDELRAGNPITHIWRDGAGRAVTLT